MIRAIIGEGPVVWDNGLLDAYTTLSDRPAPARPIIVSNPVSAADPSGVLSGTGAADSTVTASAAPATASVPVVTSNDASVPGFPSVTLGGMPSWLEWAIIAVVVFLIWHYVIRKMLKHHH